MFKIVVSGVEGNGEPFRHELAEGYAVKAEAMRAAKRLIKKGSGLGKAASTYEVIETEEVVADPAGAGSPQGGAQGV